MRVPLLLTPRAFKFPLAFYHHDTHKVQSNAMDLHIENRTALVCGSSKGLGYAVATRLCQEGARVAINGRDERRLMSAADAIERDTGHRPAACVADVSTGAGVDALIHAVVRSLGPVDILVTNAGGPPPFGFVEADNEVWHDAMELNLHSTIRLCRGTIPGMQAREWGRVVCLTSVAAKQPIAGLILSSTARAGLLGFVKSVANEISASGVTINTVCPGYTRTERVTELFANMAAKSGKSISDVEHDLVERIPARRIGKPEELAAAVAFLVSEPAAYITGATLQVDGGFIQGIL